MGYQLERENLKKYGLGRSFKYAMCNIYLI